MLSLGGSCSVVFSGWIMQRGAQQIIDVQLGDVHPEFFLMRYVASLGILIVFAA
jgi:NSS family neurotransmitter:Na+ symporter